ncbi:MAG: hypothetical protein M3R04_09515, partial [bacterium]|nr:hypothetical protein [bacterium]
MTELPQSFYKEELRANGPLRMHALLAGMLALASGWALFGLPGTPIHLLKQPEDVPFFGMGLAQLDVSPDGKWVIRRQWYADRMGRYELDSNGTLTKHRGALRPMVDGMHEEWDDLDDLQMAEGHTLKVVPSRGYYIERQDYRRDLGYEPLNVGQQELNPDQLARQKAIEHKGWKEPYVIVMTYGAEGPRAHLILQGHTYYEVLDARSFRHPNLWITTDRVKFLHRVRATDVGGKVQIEVEKT